MHGHLLAGALLLTAVAGGVTTDAQGKGLRTSNADERIVRGKEFADPVDAGAPRFFELTTIPGVHYVVRKNLADGRVDRAKRRRSLVYFAQLTDFQLADEESPSRVEFTDPGASGGWRPQEAFHPFAIDESMRRLNAFIKSPHRQADGKRAKMALALLTGDQADNQQFNETLWVRQLIEPGSKLDPNSGTNDVSSCDALARAALASKGLEAEPNYVGVQDYEDFRRQEAYYDPDDPAGDFVNWPTYRGLMDRAQEPFRTTGLKVPTYVINGNHDGLVQGNEDANAAFEAIVTGCFKATSSLGALPGLAPSLLLSPAGGEFVPPDPERRFVSKGEVRNIFEDGKQKDGHGFDFVDAAEDGPSAASGTAWYYAWNPVPGVRFIAIDTLSEGGVVAASSEGNIDDPQFRWLRRELQKAQERNKLIIVTGHHPIRTLISPVPDEAATVCAGGYEDGEYVGSDRDPKPGHNHAQHPGCDADKRSSEPIRDGEDLVDLLHEFPNVIAYVPGHTHENKIAPFPKDGGGGFWELNTSAVADWPQQSRVIEVMDNKDGTLSIWSTVTDHAGSIGIPGAGQAHSFGTNALAALGRNFSFNDPQSSAQADSEGDPLDRNVELLIDDPRDGAGTSQTAGGPAAEVQAQGEEGKGKDEGDGKGKDDKDEDKDSNPVGDAIDDVTGGIEEVLGGGA